MDGSDREPRRQEPGNQPNSGRFRSEEELAAARRRVTVGRVLTKDFRPSRNVQRTLAIVWAILLVPFMALLIWLGGWSRGSVMIAQSLTIPLGFLLLSLGFSGREDVGVPLCGKCRHALPPDTTPDRCVECGAWLRSGVQVVRDGRPVRKPGFMVAGAAILVLYFGSLSWNMLGLSAALPNGALIAWAASGTGDLGVWHEIERRTRSGRLSPTELDELAAIAIATLDRDGFAPIQARAFLDILWATGRLSPQRQQECIRIAYNLKLERRGDRAVLVVSARLSPRPSFAHFQWLAIDRLVIDGRPGPPVRRIVENQEIAYEGEGRRFELDLGEVPAGARKVSVEGFVLVSPFARGTAEWEHDSGLLNLDPGTLAAPFVVDGPP